jgi:spermidine/putrescine transport system substrate-binding protein
MITMKRLLYWLLLTSASIATAGEPARLNLFIWSEYIDPAIVRDFEKQFDCKVTIDLYEDAESMLAKLQSGGVSLYDVVVPPDHIVPALIKLQLLAPLRHENLPGIKNLDEQFTSPPFDRENRYTVAYQWGTVGIFARMPKDSPWPKSWSVVLDPKQQPGPVVLIDSVRDLMGSALKLQGHSLNSTDPGELKAARDLLLQAKKKAVGFEGSVAAKNRVLAKSAVAAIVYSGEAVRGMEQDPETSYFIPTEGSQIWVDNLAIPAKAPHRDLAERFINFILDPKVGARLSKYTRFASPNKAALAMLPATDLKNPAIYPPAELRSRLEFLQDLGNRTRLFDEIWTQVKSR